MRAICYESFGGPLTVEELQDPQPNPDGVVLKVLASGLCRSDWHGWMGHDPDIVLPHVPGHEMVGTVVELGKEVNEFKPGDRVTLPFVCGCGSCRECVSSNQQVCDYQSQPGFTHWGSFAEYVRVDYADHNLVKLPESISDISAAALGCRFITSFRAVVHQGQIKEGQFLAVHGCGGVGLSAVMIGAALGAQVIAIDINEKALEIARSIGASHAILSNSDMDVVEMIKSVSNGGVHVSLDALGSMETSTNSIACLKKRGKHVQVGLMTGDHQMIEIPMDKIVANELEILGSHGMQAYKYPEMLDMIINGKLHPEKLVTTTVNLEQATTLLPKMDAFDHSGLTIINRF